MSRSLKNADARSAGRRRFSPRRRARRSNSKRAVEASIFRNWFPLASGPSDAKRAPGTGGVMFFSFYAFAEAARARCRNPSLSTLPSDLFWLARDARAAPGSDAPEARLIGAERGKLSSRSADQEQVRGHSAAAVGVALFVVADGDRIDLE